MKPGIMLFVFISLFPLGIQAQDSTNTYRKFEMNGVEYQTNGIDTIYIVDPMPEYPGGIERLHSFISRKLEYPIELYDNGLEGSVVVQFAIDEQGKVQEVEIVESTDERFNVAAVEVFQKMRRWKPGEQNGKPVKVYFTFPLNFKIK